MSNFIRKALSAALATAILGSAALALAPTAASAQVLVAKSVCAGDGFYHVVTYDITDPDNWVVVEDLKTAQPCGPALILGFNAGLGRGLIRDVRRDERIDTRRDERRDVRTEARHDDHPVRIATRSDR